MPNYNVISGFVPEPNGNESTVATVMIDIDSGNTVPLFYGSPVYLVNGKVRGLPAGSTTSQVCKGTVQRLLYRQTGANNDNRTVNYVEASKGGFAAEISFDPNQTYLATINGVAAGTIVGSAFTITNEQTAPSVYNPQFGPQKSTRQIDASGLHATDGIFVVDEVVGQLEPINNNPAEDNLLVRCRINGSNYQQ